MIERGAFAVIEGVGGAGKSTIGEQAYQDLCREFNVHLTREPGGVATAERIRSVIFNLGNQGLLSPDHQMAFFFASRVAWLGEVVIPRLELGIHVLSDRTFPSTMAYQGYGEGGNLEVISAMTKEVMGNYMPNGIILLDVKPETALSRSKNEGRNQSNEKDPFDEKDIQYFTRIVDGYRTMAEEKKFGIPWYIVDAERPIFEVRKAVTAIITGIFKGEI